MKNIINDVKGITIITLIIIIVVLLILTSIGTYSGLQVIKFSKLNTFTTEMKIMQIEVNELYQKYKDGDNTILDLGKDLSVIQEQANKVFTESASGIIDQNRISIF